MVLRAITQQSLEFFTSRDWLSGEGVNRVPSEVNDDDDARTERFHILFKAFHANFFQVLEKRENNHVVK